jgi:hypothetical protein
MEKIFLCDSKYFSSIIIYSYQYDDRRTSDEQTISMGFPAVFIAGRQ